MTAALRSASRRALSALLLAILASAGGGGTRMTLEEALALKKGDKVTTPHSKVRHQPLRVTAVWVNDARTIVMIRIAAVDSSAWLHATGYELPPAGHEWDRSEFRWVTKEYAAEKKRIQRGVA